MPGHDGVRSCNRQLRPWIVHAPAVEPHDCAGSAVHDVTMFGSLSRPGEPQPPDHQFNFSNSHFTVVRNVAPSLHILGLADSDVDEPKWKSTGHLARLGRELIPEQTIIRIFDVLIRRHVSLLWKYCLGRVKD